MQINATRWNRVRYTLWAPVYDGIAGYFQPQRQRSIELLELQPGERVLLVGAGTGLDLDFLPPHARIVATDLTPRMLERLERRAARLGRQVEARVMNGQALEFGEGEFDAVILHLILAVIPDPVACIREAARVLKPGGRVAILDKFAPEGRKPALFRRLLNPVTNLLATNITRALEPLLRAADLEVQKEEISFHGLLRIVVAARRGRAA